MSRSSPAASEILRLRVANHGLARARFDRPEQVVAWFGAVQAQDYLGSLWALGMRMRRSTEGGVEAAESRRAILRTWPMRGTLHFVAAADARWMTELLAPRVIARNAARIKREVDLDSRDIGRARDALTHALAGGRRLERGELYRALEAKRIRTAGSRGLHIVGWLAMEGTLCFAGRAGKQQTFALLDEWIPDSTRLERDAALAELAWRYFRSRGPATLQDFTWWAGLTVRDAKTAIDGAGRRLEHLDVDGQRHWLASKPRAAASHPGAAVRLLPAFDEYTVAYRDRSSLAPPTISRSALLGPAILADGKIIGAWKRVLSGGTVRIQARLHGAGSGVRRAALQGAAREYGAFLGCDAQLAS